MPSDTKSSVASVEWLSQMHIPVRGMTPITIGRRWVPVVESPVDEVAVARARQEAAREWRRQYHAKHRIKHAWERKLRHCGVL